MILASLVEREGRSDQVRTEVAGIILNMSHGGRHELSKKEVEDILGYPIIANIKNDTKIRKSLHQQVPLTYRYPRSKSSKEYHKVAEHLSHQISFK